MQNLNEPIPYEKYKYIFSSVPRLCVDLIIKTDQGVLLTLRSIDPHRGKWHLPGGTVRFKESLQDAVARVAKNEVGIEVNIQKCLGYMEFFDQDKDGGFDYPVSLAFLCLPSSTKFKLNAQAFKVQFFQELPSPMIKEHQAFLEALT